MSLPIAIRFDYSIEEIDVPSPEQLLRLDNLYLGVKEVEALASSNNLVNQVNTQNGRSVPAKGRDSTTSPSCTKIEDLEERISSLEKLIKQALSGSQAVFPLQIIINKLNQGFYSQPRGPPTPV